MSRKWDVMGKATSATELHGRSLFRPRAASARIPEQALGAGRSLPEWRDPACCYCSTLCSCGSYPRGKERPWGSGLGHFPGGGPRIPPLGGLKQRGWPGASRGAEPCPGGSLVPVPRQHMDHYSRTKAIADQLTLMANGTPLPGEYQSAWGGGGVWLLASVSLRLTFLGKDSSQHLRHSSLHRC